MKDSVNVNDFQTVTRFENFGGGWGYSGHSVEAIRFMADTDVVLGKNDHRPTVDQFDSYLCASFQLDSECTVAVESIHASLSCTTWAWKEVDMNRTERY